MAIDIDQHCILKGNRKFKILYDCEDEPYVCVQSILSQIAVLIDKPIEEKLNQPYGEILRTRDKFNLCSMLRTILSPSKLSKIQVLVLNNETFYYI